MSDPVVERTIEPVFERRAHPRLSFESHMRREQPCHHPSPLSIRLRMNQTFTERRQYPRVEFRLPLHYRSTELHAAHGMDLSELGMAIVTTETVPIGTELELFLINRNVRVAVIVENQVPIEHDCFRTGLRFPKPEPELVHLLLSSVESSPDRAGR